MAEQEEQVEAIAAEDNENDDNPDYKAPAQKSLDEILKQDQCDESLQKYKKQLLAEAAVCGETIIHDHDNPCSVIVKKLAISVEGRDDIEIDLTAPRETIKESKVVLKEGSKYRVKIMFLVQRDIVSGLRYEQKVYRKGIKVDKGSFMVGSYGPKKHLQVCQAPFEEAPAGAFSRGDYKVESRFTDDDGTVILEWEWHLSIKKDFE